MPKWFYRVDEVELGPVTEAELQFLHAERLVNRNTPVRESESLTWTPFARVMETRHIPNVRQQNTSTGSTGHKRLQEESKPEAPTDSYIRHTDPPPLNSEYPASKTREQNSAAHAGIGIAVFLLVLLLLLMWDWSTWPGTTGPKGQKSGDLGNKTVNTASNTDGADVADMNGSADGQSDSALTGEAHVAESISSGQPGPVTDSADKSNTEELSSDDGLLTTHEVANDANPDTNKSMEEQATSEESKRLATESFRNERFENQLPDARLAVTAPGGATFFGIRSAGRRFVFVVDSSGSMAGERMQQAKDELISCLQSMPATAQFSLIFFDSVLHEYISPTSTNSFKHATKKELEAAKAWIRDNISAGGGTDVQLGMSAALSLKPAADVIFLMTDGEFDTSTPQSIRTKNTHNVLINTIAFKSKGGEPMLMEIAKDSGGDYKYVP